MIFTGDKEQTVQGGTYSFQATVNTGAVTLTFSVDNGEFKPVKGGVFTVDDSDILEIGTCRLKAGLTNDADFRMTISQRQ